MGQTVLQIFGDFYFVGESIQGLNQPVLVAKTGHVVHWGRKHCSCGQDANASIESYHDNLMVVMKAYRGNLLSRKVEWLVHLLVGDVINRYDFMMYKKTDGLVSYKIKETHALTAFVCTQDIPNECVQLPDVPGGPAYRTTQWAIGECIHAKKGGNCKHRVKVL